MLGKLTGQQLLLILVGIVLVVLFVRWIICRQKKTIHLESKKVSINNISDIRVDNGSQPSINTLDAPFTLYYFYSLNCPHCRNFTPNWEIIKSRLSHLKELSIKEIDANKPENENIIFYYNIGGYPTLILVTPEKNVEYTGNRQPDDLFNFVMSHINENTSQKTQYELSDDFVNFM